MASQLCDIDSVNVPVRRLDGKADTVSEVVSVGSPDAGSNTLSSPRPIDKADSSPGKQRVASYTCTPDIVV